jgi:tRNA(Ile)-lysidine synthase
VTLAIESGCAVTAHHVNHGLRPDADADALIARRIAEQLGAGFVEYRVDIEPGPNLEARARQARIMALPVGVLTGHTADDQAETLLLRLIRGSGSDGLAAMSPGRTHPILALRRSETVALCRERGLLVASDSSNLDPAHQRNRIRHEVLPLLTEIAGRDLVPILNRSADLLREESAWMDTAATSLDPTDARAIAAAPLPLARRALRAWLAEDGYPPDAASIERVLEVARGEHTACQVSGGRRVERSLQRLRVVGANR